MKFYLEGMAPMVVDMADSVYETAPTVTILSVVMVVMVFTSIAFMSAFIGIRLLVTVLFSLAWVFGLLVILFQDVQVLGAQGDGLHWLVPLLLIPVMVGLTLDYDLFLISRIYEYRRSGLSTKDSVVAGVTQTGGVITVAGLIMIVAFSSLMTSSIHILRSVGLMLVLTCAVDTFIIRTLLVPALLLVAVEWNWWPGCVPSVSRRVKLVDASDLADSFETETETETEAGAGIAAQEAQEDSFVQGKVRAGGMHGCGDDDEESI